MKRINCILLVFMVLFSGLTMAQTPLVVSLSIDKDLKPFPQAEDGMVRHVIELNSKDDESLYKVEIIPGKVVAVDCNRHFLVGTLEAKDVKGWGYTYYDFKTEGMITSTMMACFGEKQEKFISSQPLMVRYNSKLPIVIYAPQGYEIRYRIWSAGEEVSSVEK